MRFDFIRRTLQGPSTEELMQESAEFAGANLDTYTVTGDIPEEIVAEERLADNELYARGYRYRGVEQRWIK